MSDPSTYTLNHYCLFSIFEQLKKNCERDQRNIPDIIRYRDVINLAITNDQFHSLFQYWNQSLYKRLEVEKFHSWTCRILSINFYELLVSQRNCTLAEKEAFWDIFCTAIKDNTRVTGCYLSYKPKTYCADHVEIFEWTMRLLQKKTSLKKIALQMIGYSPEHLESFHNLQSLLLDVPMDASALKECVKSNPNLIELEFISTEMYGRLTDITPYCRNLERLTIQMKTETDAKEYGALANLPKLKDLSIFGYPKQGSLRALFVAMAINRSTVLQYLSVQQAMLEPEEVEELSNIHSLHRLRCELAPTRSPAIPSAFELPNICSIEMEAAYELDHTRIDIMANRGQIGLVIHTKRERDMLIRLNNWHKNKISPLLLEKQKLTRDLEIQQINRVFDPKCLEKIAAISLLEAFPSQFPTHVHNIHLLTQIRELKQLEVKVKINIEEELRRLIESNRFVGLEDSEMDIAIEPETQEIIALVQVTYLKEIFGRSKFTFIRNEITIRNFELELDFDFRL